MLDSPVVEIYTDGAASGNPGPGGYGIVLKSGKHRKELSGGFRKTTNNRMELLAVIIALESLKKPNCNVTVYTDSKYVSDAFNLGWIERWKRKNFKKVKNPDLWHRLLKVINNHNVKFVWVKGHADNPENNLCDKLAVQASKQANLPADEYYETLIENPQNTLDF
ncbi:MAG TPA: ribonuclease HI [Bacteroidales bacterium]|jgi:ribonuclease HI|nr:ribonuclease HI [Bacteroidales bacterium]HOL97905.1 ribonuclease HI [Bacteroidales bacterium]HOM35649.1 ribonuclease HI [Bacteroidales bacterium]HPD22790.1 ribonuclease HI [Bacteroidales bacterium]HRS98947.1 ribonuclease HI [Bacteroidales bacterium]